MGSQDPVGLQCRGSRQTSFSAFLRPPPQGSPEQDQAPSKTTTKAMYIHIKDATPVARALEDSSSARQTERCK